MDQITLSLTARDKTLSAKQLRRSGQVPCIVYGNEVENMQLQCPHTTIRQAYIKAGTSTLVTLEAEGKQIPVLFHAVDFEPVKSTFDHVDFYAVNMKKEVEAEVALHFEGESLAVKEGGILVTPITHLSIRCLPKDLPRNLVVDISSLIDLNATITLKDLKLPAGVSTDADPELMIVAVQEPRKEEEATPVAATEGAAAAPVEGAAPAAEAKEEKK